MAKSTFSGPVKSLSGFISAGNTAVVSLTADTTLSVDSHAGKILLCNDADGKFTLPSIVTTVPSDPTDPNQLNNLGASFTFVVVTAATDLDIKTDGTDKFVGSAFVGIDDAVEKVQQLRGVESDWISSGHHSIGVIAQDVEKVAPELVSTCDDGMKGVDYGKLTAILIEAVKDQQKQIEDLKSRLDELTK